METLDNTSMPRVAQRIGFWPRVGASLLDSLLMFVVTGIVAYLAVSLGASEYLTQKGLDMMKIEEEALEALEQVMGDYFVVYMSAMVVMMGVGLSYNLIEGFIGASPGKMILGLQIAHEDGTAGNVNLYMMRWLLKNASGLISLLAMATGINALSSVSSLVSLIFLVGCFVVLGEKKQGFHDSIAKTAVYKKVDIAE